MNESAPKKACGSPAEGDSCDLPQDQREAGYTRLCSDEGKSYDPELMIALAEIMKDSPQKRADRPKRARTMPSGFVYLGQFIDHDLTRDPRNVDLARAELTSVPNNRTPRLDLDHLYGKKGTKIDCLYDDKGHLLLGETEPSPGWPAGDDLHRRDDGKAIVVDPRNDENLFIAQMHVLWSKLHNRLLDLVAETPKIAAGVPDGDLRDRVRTLVTWHYQWIVWYDFLPHIVRKVVLDEVRAKNLKLYCREFIAKDPFDLPIEFTMAAFRFGHSMVQENYRINRKSFASINRVLELTHPGGGIKKHLSAEWVVDWRYFFTDTMLNVAENIDTFITEALCELEHRTVQTFRSANAAPEHLVSGFAKISLPYLTLTRGSNSLLPSGEQFAAAFKFPLLRPSQIHVFPKDEAFFAQAGMKKRTPLWYYLLREAAVEAQPEPATAIDPTPIQKLGTIGSRLVAEVIYQVLSADSESIFNQGQNWKPPFIRLKPSSPSFPLNSMAAIVDFVQTPLSPAGT